MERSDGLGPGRVPARRSCRQRGSGGCQGSRPFGQSLPVLLTVFGDHHHRRVAHDDLTVSCRAGVTRAPPWSPGVNDDLLSLLELCVRDCLI